MCPQFSCNYHSACTIRAFLPCFFFSSSPFSFFDSFFLALSCGYLERKGCICLWDFVKHWKKINCQCEWCFLALGQWRRAHLPFWLAGCQACQYLVFRWQEDWQWGTTGPIKHDCRLKCILTLADLISWIRGRAKRKEVIMIAVSYYGIDLLTWTNTHRTKTQRGIFQMVAVTHIHSGAVGDLNSCHLHWSLLWKLFSSTYCTVIRDK